MLEVKAAAWCLTPRLGEPSTLSQGACRSACGGSSGGSSWEGKVLGGHASQSCAGELPQAGVLPHDLHAAVHLPAPSRAGAVMRQSGAAEKLDTAVGACSSQHDARSCTICLHPYNYKGRLTSTCILAKRQIGTRLPVQTTFLDGGH